MFTFLVLFVLALAITWYVASWCNYIRSDEVALRRFFGRLEEKVRKSGLVFVPLFPGVDLVRIPTRQIPFRFEGELDHCVWSKDRQLLLVDISGYVRFPYDEAASLALMVKSGVPMEGKALQEWMEEEVISGLRNILADYTLEEAIGHSNLTAIRDAAKDFFLDATGLFAKSGICGNDPKNFTPGTGEVIVRVEQINPTPELQKAMQAPVESKYRADAARETAKMNAEQVGGQILGIVARKHGMTVKALEKDLKNNPKKAGLPIAEGGYRESFAYAEDQTKRDRAASAGELTDLRVGSTDGTPLKGDLGALAAVAALFGRGGGGQGNRSRGPRGEAGGSAGGEGGGQPLKTDKQSAQEFADAHGGQYPRWDPGQRQPQYPG